MLKQVTIPVEETEEYDGMVGRIPCKLFEALKDNTSLTSVFKGIKFMPLLIFKVKPLLGELNTRQTYLKYNTTKLEDISNIFAQTSIS